MCQSTRGECFPDALRASRLLHLSPGELQPVPSPRYQRKYEARVPDGGGTLELVLAPPPMARLLRSEQCLVNTEAVVIRWIQDIVSQDAESRSRARSRRGGTTVSSGSQELDEHGSQDLHLSDLLPTLVQHCSAPSKCTTTYSIIKRPRGVAVTALPSSLTEKELGQLDFQKGRLARKLSTMTSPSGRFGIAVAVLTEDHPCQDEGDHQEQSSPGGARTWSGAFHSLLESILRDGEDMAVTIAYSVIRRHFKRLRNLLDSVSVPRLVVIDGAENTNLLVTTTRSERKSPRTRKDMAVSDERSEGRDVDEEQKQQSIRVAGLRDWSNCVFGDPLFSRALSDDPSDAFLLGFHGSPLSAGSSHNGVDKDLLIEDRHNARARLLIYQAYHAIVAVVSEFYGKRTERSKVELAARKKLAGILAQLEEVDEEPKRRHRRPSGEMSPAKKLRERPGGSCSPPARVDCT